jgi:hypothetical protein
LLYPRLVAWPVFGNHDGYSAVSATLQGPYYDIFSPPTAGQSGGVASNTEAFYSFNHGNVLVIVLNSFDVPRYVRVSESQ